MNAATDTAIDDRNPWLGLASFTEETRAYFYGREEEVAELARRVQRKLLTVLFGQSGLGKTSILRAGLVPKLRAQGYCPVYVRIDYARDAPEPAEQIKQAIAGTARANGQWSQAGVAAAGESLWEFLHHRDDVLQDASGQTLIPLVIFDQFEEIFTLAQSDDVGRARAARFIQDLSDLVENRPPRQFEALLDSDDSAAERFDFARSDYRVLIALREDYLAPLESLKRSMPSIAQNRLRLAPMTGQQALAAVMKPGRGMVNDEVAQAIVRFVAGGAEIQNAEVEPALLSLVCRELNDARVAAGRNEISPDLLKGSQDSILGNFYERSLADQPASVRRVIEDQLLTASGFRENIAEERLLTALNAAGAAPQTLSVLVNRRLLRVEERLDLRRVELTHDVLCGVVKASRDQRQERETREAAEQLLAEQRGKEAAARQALVRARQIAVGCALLALLAVVAAIVAVISTQRARRAEQATQQARVQAEALVGYLSDDFAAQLETYGQLSTIAEISQRQIDYFRGLPASLKGFESIRNGALALVNFSHAERTLGKLPQAAAAAREAVALLDQAGKDGDSSEAHTIALARAYTALAGVMTTTADPEGLPTAKKARDLIAPLASAPNASVGARTAYAATLVGLGYGQGQFEKEFKDGVENLKQAQQIAASLGAREIKTPAVAALYVGAAVWEAEILRNLGREEESLAVDTDADRIGRQVLETRPNYRSLLHDVGIIELDLGSTANAHMDPATGLFNVKRGLELYQRLLRTDPDNNSSRNNTAVTLLTLGDIAWNQGDVTLSFDYYDQAGSIQLTSSDRGAWYVLNSLITLGVFGGRLADASLDIKAAQIGEKIASNVQSLKTSNPQDSRVSTFAQCALLTGQAGINLGLGNYPVVRSQAVEARQLVQGIEPNAPFEGLMKYNCVVYGPLMEGVAGMWLGDNAAALTALQSSVSARSKYPVGGLDERRALSITKVYEALVLVRLGRVPEARALLDPEMAFQKELFSRNKGDVTQFMDYAQVLYVASLIDESRRGALRSQALGLIDRLPPEFRKLRSTTHWREVIQRGR
jgi:tetratricopeptide (TPR) repeat protein